MLICLPILSTTGRGESRICRATSGGCTEYNILVVQTALNITVMVFVAQGLDNDYDDDDDGDSNTNNATN